VITNTSATVNVSSSMNPSLFGQSVTFTATVMSSGSGSPTGTVIFFDGSASIGQGVLTNVGGLITATFATNLLSVNAHPLTASYSGDNTFAGSSGNLSGGPTVSTAGTSAAVSSSLLTSVFGQRVTLTATVSVVA